MKTIITTLLLLAGAFLAPARLINSWSHQQLYDQADLVIIAKPISTQESGEKAVLPNISPDVYVDGLSTQFDIDVVMKGEKSLKKCVLHHFRLTNPKEIMKNAPNLASFDPRQHNCFLLFLHREADGRYAPVSGQTDPALSSVQKLEEGVSVTTSDVPPEEAAPPPKYSLSVGRVYEPTATQPEWVFIFGGPRTNRGIETVCKSFAALKTLLKGLPRGSTLDWWPTCKGESEALDAHLDDLKNICTEAGIVFTIHPAG